MISETIFIVLLAVIVLSITTIFLADSLRTTLIFLTVLYFCVFFLLLQVWPVGLAAVNLITGILTVAVINTYCSNLTVTNDSPRNVLDILTIVFIGVITFAFAPQLATYLTESSQFLIIGFFLFAIGLLQAGISSDPFRVLIGLLIFSLGFQVIYAPLEGSALVTALMSVIQIVLAFVVSRLIMRNREEV
ncbi:MAG TPA: hypothetical protein DDX29_00200 [Clostridiales bacterium]|uniref:Uncharacterized protein n=1 Tax=Anaerolinea thermophila TaxID=167964 RepID=A0A101FXT9_9CHLR|nr:MAG: hypothetical protein XD73_0716 [Anaerolinea thermophila]HBH11535.1 hypothetical protein [Clostridiales bacterium]